MKPGAQRRRDPALARAGTGPKNRQGLHGRNVSPLILHVALIYQTRMDRLAFALAKRFCGS